MGQGRKGNIKMKIAIKSKPAFETNKSEGDEVLLAIDQAANASGWALFKGSKLEKYGMIYPTPTTAKGGERLASLWRQFDELISNAAPDIVVIEAPLGGVEDGSGPAQNWRTMAVLFEVFGMLTTLIELKGLPCAVVAASAWQNTCSIFKRDRASRKAGARNFVEKTYGLTQVEQDVCDAICIGSHFIETERTVRSAF